MRLVSLPLWLLPNAPEDSGRGRGDVRAHEANSPDRGRAVGRDLLPTISDDTLVAGIRDGDERALERIVREAFDGLASFAAGYLRSRDAAEDVVQSVLVRLWEDRGRLDASVRLRSYLYTAVRNRALDALKHERVAARFRVVAGDEMVSPVPSTDRAVDRQDEHDTLEHALAMLTDRQREAVRLRYQAQLTIPDVAAALHVSTRATERLLERALTELRVILGVPDRT